MAVRRKITIPHKPRVYVAERPRTRANSISDYMAGQITFAKHLEELDYFRSQGNWTPACGGTETEFKTRTGRRLLYCYQASTGRHAYLDLDTDIILEDAEAQAALGMG